MSLAKIASGDGYEYYLRNIATHDANERGPQALADYYSERGESPGRWWGSGLADLTVLDADGRMVDFIVAGDEVTESQMWALMGRGLHPNAEALIAEEVAAQRAAGKSARIARNRALRAKARIGTPFGKPKAHEIAYRAECRRAYEAWNVEHSRLPGAPIPDTDRDYIATEVAGRMFLAEHGHAHRDEQELSAWVAKAARPHSKRVAGFDLTFSPAKSVSALWALERRPVAEIVENAHHAAIADALTYLQDHATFTRIGDGGIAQVEVGGLIATMFDHRDSRAGDPDLHTHVVISNKVRRLTGEWGALDGRMLYQHAVTASEIYNSRLEHHLETALPGIEFTERPGTDPSKRPVRELAGFSPALAAQWSSRAQQVSAKVGQLSADFQARHGREPSQKELWRLAEQAALSTRGDKHHARSRAEQRRDWRIQAQRVLGSAARLDTMLYAMTGHTRPTREPVSAHEIARQVLDVVAEERATWQAHHVRAETVRQLRGRVASADWAQALEQVSAVALGEGMSIPRRAVDPAPAAAGLVRSDGTSVYVRAESTKYTSREIVAAEHRLLAAARLDGGRTITATAIALAEVEFAANGHELNPGQRGLVHACATSGRRFMAAVAPAGTGKTTGMRVLVNAWTATGGTVIAIAPTAAAAAVLAEETGVPASMTVDMLLTLAEYAPERLPVIDETTLVVIDEAAKTSTLKLDAAVHLLIGRGATIRAIGDDRQLSSVEAGGIVRDIVASTPSPTLTQVMRFTDPSEAAASLAVRQGDPAGLAYYFDRSRVHVGTEAENVAAAFRAWRVDFSQGRDAAMLAPTRALVGELNALARADRLARGERHGEIPGPEIVLGDGLSASVGDIIATRRNDSRLRISDTDYVRNGYRWEVRAVHEDGRITAAHLGSGRRVALPADYVRTHVGLGYATTIDSAQGITVDRCHGVLTGRESRAQLYVIATRGRSGNYFYLSTATAVDEHAAHAYEAIHPPTALDLLTGVLAREGTQTSATTQARDAADPHRLLADAGDAYRHALAHIAETRVGAERLAEIEALAERLVPGITDAPAWPVLREHLAVLEVSGADAAQALTDAATAHELASAADPAAVLDWRIDPTGRHSQGDDSGPLPWLPAIPSAFQAWEQDRQHLTVRAEQIRALAADIAAHARTTTGDTVPLWAAGLREVDPALTAELAVWRAAHRVPDLDRRPTGPRQYPVADRREQQRLDAAVAERVGGHDSHARRWRPVVDALDTRIATDPYWPTLATEFTRAAVRGVDIPDAVRTAHAARQLPAEQPAAALRWRMATALAAPAPQLPREIGDGAVPQLDAAPVVDERAEALARARAQLHRLRSDDPRRMSDAALADAVARHEPLFDGGLAAVHANRIYNAKQRLARLETRHRELDEHAAAIRRAQPAVTAAESLRRDLYTLGDQIRTAQHQLDTTRKIRWRARAEQQAHLTELHRQRDEVQQRAAATDAHARHLIIETTVPESWWDRTLTEADDHQGRAADIADATRELAVARAADERLAARDRTPFQDAVRAEIARRDQLSELDLEAEEIARAEADNQPAPTPGTGARQRRTRAKRLSGGGLRRVVWDNGPSSGYQHGPPSYDEPSNDRGYGL